MDATQKLVFDAEISVGVLGKGESFVLVPLTEPGPLPQAVLDGAKRRDLAFVGVLGVVDGEAFARCEPGVGAIYTMMHAALAFAQQVADRLRPRGNGVGWLDLERLWELPDPRGEA